MRRIWTTLALTVVCLCLGRPGWAQAGGLTGKCTLADGTLCAGCTVKIERQDIKGEYSVKTNKKGVYVHIGLPIGRYKITLLDPSGKPVFFMTHNVDVGAPTEVNFDLPKERTAQQENPAVKKQIEQQQKQQQQFTNLKQLDQQGNQQMQQGQYADAAATFEKAMPLATGKNQAIVLGQLASAYDKAKQYDKAVGTYQKLLAANPNDAELHNDLGTVYAHMGKNDQAMQEFQKAAQLNPTGAARYYYNLGAILTNAGKSQQAADAFKKATEADPAYADAYFLEGQNLVALATMSKAGKLVPAPGTVEALQKYLQLQPSGKYAASARQMIQALGASVETHYKQGKKH